MSNGPPDNQEDQAKKSTFSFIKTEHEVLKFWKERDIFKKSLAATQGQSPYIFYDGPPFATGLPHHGHLVGAILKDIIPRYFTMRGHYVERRFGWDCHGIPIEYEIDKKLGMSAQAAVEKLGIKGYNDECRGIVQRFTSEWEKTITRIGRWVDFENGYKTMDLSFMESEWWVFKQLWKKNLIYQGTKVMPFSTALGTSLSNFEAGQNYQQIQDPAVTVLFKLDDEDAYMAAWTTTPWTLPSNLGLCVGDDIDYVLLWDSEREIHLYMAKGRVESYQKKHKLEIKKVVKGTALKGRRYTPLFPYFSDLKSKGAFTVFSDDYVTVDDGTGIVHTAPSFGEDDNRIMKEAGVHLFACPIDEAGNFTAEVSDYKGMYVKDADKQIQRDLKERGVLYEQAVVVHSYPFCYRSDTPLLYRAVPSWYVKVDVIKERLIKSNQQINWVPDHIKNGRFGKWLQGARDWAISRNRIWGTPLPIWINDVTGSQHCIGSIAELSELTGEKITDLHRESVDHLTFSMPDEEGVYRRIPEVLDCWFESGSMPYAQLHYPFENKQVFEAGFPAQFIAEGLDQTRGWFYTLNILSTALFDRPAFYNVIVNGIVLAKDGKKMSKRLKNYTAPDELMESYGADALRLYLINSGLVKGEEQRFCDEGVKEMVRRALLPWYNAFKFFHTYAQIDGWSADKNFVTGENITDRWIISNLQTLKKNIAHEMKSYHLYNVVPALFVFIEDLTNWYIRLNRGRFWGEGLTDDKCAAYSTLFTTVKELSLAMAPFAPFLSEFIYQELKAFTGEEIQESVHLCCYPEAHEELIDSSLEEAVGGMQQIILLGRQKRNQVSIKTKTPLAQITIIHKDKSRLDEIAKLEEYIATELNMKKVSYSQAEEKFIRLFAKPNSPVLGKRLGKAFGQMRKEIESLSPAALQQLEEQGEIDLAGEKLSAEDILIFREPKEGTEALSNRFISIAIDCQLTQDLIDEGLAREVVNRIQKSRKEMDLKVDERINITYQCGSQLEQVMAKHQEYIIKETLTSNLVSGTPHEGTGKFEYEVEKCQLLIHIARL